MLLAIRERVMGIVGWVLLGFLAVAFAFFGLNSYLGDTSRSYAASVNDVEISTGALKKAYQVTMTRLQDNMGESFDPAMFDEEFLKKTSLERLIREELLLQEAEADGFTVSKEQVAARISSVDAFKKDDAFSSEKYERLLSLQGLTPSRFEWSLSRELITQQLRDGIIRTAEPTPAVVKDIYRLQAQQRRFRYLTLPLSRYQDKVSTNDADIEKYYQDNNQEFVTPERVKLQYVELNAEELVVDSEIDEEELRVLYDGQAELYITEEERQVRHILISVPQDASEDAVAEARGRAESIQQKLEQGESFADLAKQESDDPGSASKGGDLGFFGKGLMAPEFEASAFSLEKGKRSEIIKTAFGFHIIEVTDIKPEVARTFEDVRDDLVKEYFSEIRSDMYYEYAESLATLAFEEPDSLDGVASELELEIRTSDWLTRAGGPGIGENPQVAEAAFSADILESRNNSEPIEISDNHTVVFRILDHNPAETKPLDSVREEVERKAHDAKARELVRNEGEQLLDELKSGVSMEEAAGKLELEANDSGFINRAASTLDRMLVMEAYQMPAGADGQPSIRGVVLTSGDYVILSLDEIRDGAIAQLSDTDRERFVAEISNMQGNAEILAAVATLRANATIIISDQKN